ncbi:tetratricopeptide repeat protein [Bacteroides sp. 214]|uniref:DUF6340 family protein n=1 Tax=Bacteroides sp. 214 TaxID=2302935 RepID=UPI0013D2E4F9|nr:DUF6340 family protein [Bacteroides sp. 214]NDW13245.1 tetratricopeptide repeat protein [Bacteroides sp. 214]
MKNIVRLLSLLMLTVCSCQTVEQISIDYLKPAEITFPEQVRKIAVVNNISDQPEINTNGNDSLLLAKGDLYIKTSSTRYKWGDARTAAESLAETIAEANYFDKVLISDSALRANDITLREATLSQTEVMELTDELDADMLVALENVVIKYQRSIRFSSYEGGYWGTTDAQVFPTIRFYLPNRKTPLAYITSTDSIFWEDFQRSEGYLRKQMISEEELVKEASDFAGTILVKHFTPQWVTADRYFFIDNSINMRDAAVHARENNWEEAVELWKKAYEDKSEKRKTRAATNIALYYEMQDDYENALAWIAKAKEKGFKAYKIDEKQIALQSQEAQIVHYIVTYEKVLTDRQADYIKLHLQMNRF